MLQYCIVSDYNLCIIVFNAEKIIEKEKKNSFHIMKMGKLIYCYYSYYRWEGKKSFSDLSGSVVDLFWVGGIKAIKCN